MSSGLRWTPEQLENMVKRGAVKVRTHKIKDDEGEGLAKIGKGDRRGAPASENEEQLAQQIQLSGLLVPIRQFKAIPGRKFRLDFAWPFLKVGVEVQGMVHRIKGRFKDDMEKRALHLLAGWRVLEVGGDEIRSGQAVKWLEKLLGEKA